MRIVRARVVPVRLALGKSLETAHGRIAERSGAFFALTDERDVTGWGESLPLPGFGLEGVECAERTLETAAATLVGARFADLDSALDAAFRLTTDAPSAQAAIDTALHDLAAQSAAVDLAAYLNPARRARIPANALIAGSDDAALATAAKAAIQSGFGTLKLKVGYGCLADDLARLAAVRTAVGPDPRIRLDANGGWSEPAALAALREIAAYDVEFVEQPVPAAQIEALARLRAASPVRIAADESVCNESDAARLLDADAADILVVKPAVVGGLRAALRIAERAQRAGVDIVVTSFLDSSLGISAALHLAAALPAAPFAAGLGSAGWLRDDPCKPLLPQNGSVAIPDAAGLGIRPDPKALRWFARGAVHDYAA